MRACMCGQCLMKNLCILILCVFMSVIVFVCFLNLNMGSLDNVRPHYYYYEGSEMCGNGFKEETGKRNAGRKMGTKELKTNVISAAAKKTLSVFCILG